MSRHERAAVMMELGLSNYLIVSMLFEQPILCNPAWTQHGQKGFLHQGPADWEGGEWKRQGQWTRLPEREACWDRPGRISESDQSHISLCVFRMMSQRMLIKSDQYGLGHLCIHREWTEKVQHKYCCLRFFAARSHGSLCFYHKNTGVLKNYLLCTC